MSEEDLLLYCHEECAENKQKGEAVPMMRFFSQPGSLVDRGFVL